MGRQLIGSVKIIHNELRGGEYRLLADYLRLIGSFVCDCTMQVEQTETDFDIVAVIKAEIESNTLDQLSKNYESPIMLEGLELANAGEGERYVYLSEFIDKIKDKSNVDDKTRLEREIVHLKEIARIYVDNNLMKARCSFAYLHKYKDVVTEAQTNFLYAYAELSSFMKNREFESRYLTFAQICLAELINQTCTFLSQEFIFDIKKLIEAARKAQTEYEAVNNYYVQQGFLSELDSQYQMEAVACYKNAIVGIEDKPYVSYTYYRLGRFFEKTKKDWNSAIKYYRESLRVNSNSYRTLYKIALYERNNKNYGEAIRCFSRICEILKKKREENYLQEKEYMYLYKAWFQMGYISAVQGNLSEAIKNYNEIIDLHSDIEKSQLLKQIYRDDAQKYIEYIQKNPGLNKIYIELSKAYEKAGQNEKSEKMLNEVLKMGE